jgi:hypothetical protein
MTSPVRWEVGGDDDDDDDDDDDCSCADSVDCDDSKVDSGGNCVEDDEDEDEGKGRSIILLVVKSP